jgi:hypothetical protein
MTPVGPGYGNGNDNGGRGNGGRGGYNPTFEGWGSFPPGRGPDWQYSDLCNSGSRWALDRTMVINLEVLVLVQIIF